MSSLQQLELERSPPKIIKTDPFSIYETTLRKLKEGSHRCLSLPNTESSTDEIHITVSHSPEPIDPDSDATNLPLISSACEDMSCSKEPRSRNSSVPFLFSKYTSSRIAPTAASEKAMIIDTADFSEGDSSSS